VFVPRRAVPAAAPPSAHTPAAAPASPSIPDPIPEPATPAAAARPRLPRAEVAATPAKAAPAVVEPAPNTGTLRIDADVAGAQVFIDRQFIGATPITAAKVTPGTHQLNVSAEGFDGVARTIDVEPGSRDLMIRFKEVRLDARIDVVHKHRIGSCRGALVATPQGLQYSTDDKDDRFTVALTDLEQFQVDYLEKNLKVKVRHGKQYNFTDSDGNADRLFVFHRDVDKARQRLAGGDKPATPTK